MSPTTTFADDQRNARLVPCTWCRVAPGEPCRNPASPDDRPLRGHLSHTCRVIDARRAGATAQPALDLDTDHAAAPAPAEETR